jgi:hypothetical protein
MLLLSTKERQLAAAYRAMIRDVRRRAPKVGVFAGRPLRGRQLDQAHKAAISRLPCAATLRRVGVLIYGVHVAHVRFSNASAGATNPGLQRKPDDRWTIPLSPDEHRLQHRQGENAYWAELALDPHQLAIELYAQSPNQADMLSALIAQVPKFAALSR